MGQPFRLTPGLPAGMMRSYQIVAPMSTHTRSATCAEVECEATQRGWITTVDECTELGAKQAHFIRHESRRAFLESRTKSGLTRFRFASGQPCFAQHRVRLDRPEIYRVLGGDWRGNPRGTAPVTHRNAADWVDDFATNQDRLKTIADRG